MTNFALHISRGDVLLVPIAFVSGQGVKVRPVVVVQNDGLNGKLYSTIVAIITSTNTHVGQEPSPFFIDVSSPEGHATGLLHNSTVKCEHLDTIDRRDVHRIIGRFSPDMMERVEQCLNVALDINN